MIAGSSMVGGTTICSSTASLRIVLRRILPERVFGSRGTTMALRNAATAPISLRMTSTSSASIAASSLSAPSFSTTRPMGTCPFSSSSMPTTAHSATAACAPISSSISPVDRRWPATLMTSSVRPITNR